MLRLRGAYFALATIGVNEAARAFVSNFSPFGGATGMSLDYSVYGLYGGSMKALWLSFALVWLIAIIVVVTSYLVKQSRFGLGLMAIREDEDAAMVMGVKTPMTKTWAYALSAFFPGIIGTIYFFKNGNVEPDDAFRLQHVHRDAGDDHAGGQGTVLGAHPREVSAYERLRGYLLVSPIVQEPAPGDLRGGPAPHHPVRAGGSSGLAAPPLPEAQGGAGMILEVREVTKRFGGLQALSNITFELGAGEILGLIGPNGAGKTTLFNAINGVFKPEHGRIVFKDEDITGFPAYEVARRGLARTYQVVRPLSDLTVRENVMVGACYGREKLSLTDAARVAEDVLAQVGLADKADHPAGSLNVAQKKRLELARALGAQPYLLLLDEVLAGLNPSEIAKMMDTIRQIRDSGITILMIEHVMQAMMSISDRILVLDYGVLIAQGLPQEVVNNPQVIEAYLGDPELTKKLLEG